MSVAVNQAALDAVLLMRIGPAGCTTAALLRDLGPFVSHALSPAAWRTLAAERTESLLQRKLAVPAGRTRLALTPKGLKASGLRARGLDADHWPHIRDTQVTARALGVPVTAKAISGLAKVDGLRLAIVQRGFGLPVAVTDAARLRKKLGACPPATGRVTSLLTATGTDGSVMAGLAAEFLGNSDRDGVNLRRRLIRNFLVPYARTSQPAIATTERTQLPVIAPAIAHSAESLPAAPLPVATLPRPDLPRFAATVRKLAEINATGWQGNKKAYISHVWRAVCATEPNWDLSENNFKTLLMAAHRGGHLELVNADLKDRSSVRDMEASATAYKNTVWHLIRVGET